MATKTKMSNEGHTGKVPLGRTIGIVFFVGLLLGGVVTFLAVAGRTAGIVEQRRGMLLEQEKQKNGQPAVTAPSPSLDPNTNKVPDARANPH